MNPGFHENQTVSAVLVLPVPFQVTTDVDSLLDQLIEILRDLRSETCSLEDPEDLAPGEGVHVRDAHDITQDHTDLRRSEPTTSEFVDLFLDSIRLVLDPSRGGAAVGERGSGDTLSAERETTK